MKWLGILCLFCTCAGLGIVTARQMRTRLAHMRRLSALLEDFSIHIRYQCLPLEDLLALFAVHPNYQSFTFLRNVSEEFCTGIPPHVLWRDAVSADSAVPPQAVQTLCALGNVLGTTDMAGQLSAIAMHRRELEGLAEELDAAYEKKGTLCRRLGVLTGAMLAILLL
ncbi:MAG: hypothetical protein E7502_04425 [Ruminococcus sp.]|nr:hypothetical protein [Ruminococcus sp.]